MKSRIKFILFSGVTAFIIFSILLANSISYAELGQAEKLFREGYYSHFKSKNDQKAIELLKKSSDFGYVLAQFLLGQIYEDGVNGKSNIDEAIRYYTLAANNGFVPAQSHLGYLYSSGKLVEKNYETSFKYYFMASEQEDGWSQYCLGQFFEYGNGVPLNYKKAIFYYEMSANHDEIKALNALGRIYEHKASKSRENLILALKWYLIGAQRHQELVAEVNSKRLSSVLLENEVNQANKLANSWAPKHPKNKTKNN